MGLRLFITILLSIYLFVSCEKDEPVKEKTNHILLGNPSGASSSVLLINNYLLEKPQYCLSYNNSKHLANWVSWHLEEADLGNIERSNEFKADSTLPSNWYLVRYADYTNSGFDRGHICPSADRTNTLTNNLATFFMTNIVAQAPTINRNTWLQFESYCRELTHSNNELYIISGTYGIGGIGSSGYSEYLKNNVCIPAYLWKIAVVIPQGTNDLSRITAHTRVIAVVMPNSENLPTKIWVQYKTSVDAIEIATGLDFLSNVPKDIQDALEQNVDNIE